MEVIYRIQQWSNTLLDETWGFFSTLTQTEWFVVLGIVAALGFLCMKGFTQRGTL